MRVHLEKDTTSIACLKVLPTSQISNAQNICTNASYQLLSKVMEKCRLGFCIHKT